jgi:hypothetical protein
MLEYLMIKASIPILVQLGCTEKQLSRADWHSLLLCLGCEALPAVDMSPAACCPLWFRYWPRIPFLVAAHIKKMGAHSY